MARKPRFTLAGMPQHVIQRGHNREPCFLAAGDYRAYLDSLKEAASRFACAIHAYVLMTNHVHLLMTPREPGAIGRCMQSVGRRYVRTVNEVHGRRGTLWEGRYRASLVETQTWLLTCYRYIELNPVRAGLVTRPGEYPWSSYAANAQGEDDSLLEPHAEYLALGPTPEGRQQAYGRLIGTQLDEQVLHTLRTALNQELVTGFEWFIDHIESTISRRVRPGQPGRPRLMEEVKEEADEYLVY